MKGGWGPSVRGGLVWGFGVHGAGRGNVRRGGPGACPWGLGGAMLQGVEVCGQRLWSGPPRQVTPARGGLG